jgi:murein DD-endopeptidase MepM/ murein hydrolase activator NlpD
MCILILIIILKSIKMKKYVLLLVMFFITIDGKSQELIISKQGSQIIYNSSEKRITKVAAQTKRIVCSNQTSYIDKITYYSNQIDQNLEVTVDYDFFQGIQNPNNSNVWVFMERRQIGASFNLKIFDKKTGETQIILSVDNTSRQKMAFKPIAWSNNSNEIFVEGLFLDTSDEHEGIWKLNLENQKLTKIEIPEKIMRTPLLSPDRNSFYYLGTLDTKIDILHGNTNIVYEYNLLNNDSKTITQSKGNSFVINGWKNKITNKLTSLIQSKVSSLEYYLPWDFGTDLCVSRHGTPEPTGAHVNQGRCGFFTNAGGHHGYPAVDFATSQTSNDNVRAAAAGTVSFAGISSSLTSGYGRLVIILHSDGTRTYYGHNSSILVSENQTVTKGQVIALEGTTGGSTGDHIHFEWREAGGNASTMGTFTGIGQPRQDFIYRSNNSITPVNTPIAVSPAAGATNIGLPITFSYTTPVNANAFRIQVSTSNTGWNDTNGFTTDTAPNATVVVNASITGLSFNWAEGVAGIFEGPKASKTYYYTVRSFDTTTGTSKYTVVKSFSTIFGVQPALPLNAASVTKPVTVSWTSTTASASYRLQISKVNSGWTATNGFTTDANPTANVPVNYSAANLLSYAWPNSGTTTANQPVVGATYYWTVRLFSTATGSSLYSPVRSFTISGTARMQNAIKNEVRMFPNPSNGEISVSYESKSENAEMFLYDLKGNQVFSKKYLTQKGETTLKETVFGLIEGNYILKIIDGENILSQNVIIQNK